MEVTVVSLTIIGWIPVAASLFMFFKPIRALTLAYLIGWLLLPVDSVAIHGFWDVDKVMATNIGVLFGSLLFCPGRLTSLRLRAPEYILLAYAGGTLITSLSNDLGLYDGVSSFVQRLMHTAVPFCVGRAFVRNRSELMEIARAVVYAASLYALLAIWEWRMSPQIHKTLYGYFQHSFAQHMRWGFYRPIVCFPHTLGLGAFLAWTTLLAIAMYRAGELRPLLIIPPQVLLGFLLLALLACMSFGPWGLFLAGFGMYVYRKRQRWRWMLWVPLVLAFAWMAGRHSGVLDGAWMESAVKEISADRAKSLHARIHSETVVLAHAAEHPLFGWGGFGRARVYDQWGKEVVTDGLWIILLGMYGIAGLASFYLWWCWPIIMTRRAKASLAED
ncbi:MAG TPA: hypothetical protein P5572_11620, partial [Phycisphaerae bacterium]|nr:hypothetical protein [Phycisphaerae bacterium]